MTVQQQRMYIDISGGGWIYLIHKYVLWAVLNKRHEAVWLSFSSLLRFLFLLKCASAGSYQSLISEQEWMIINKPNE